MSSAFRIKGGSGGTTVKLKSGGGLALDANSEMYVAGNGTSFALDSQVFTFTGTVAPVVGAARWYPYVDSIATEFYASIEQAPTSKVTLQLKKNGFPIGSPIDITAGNFKSNVITLSEGLLITDYLTVDVTHGNSGFNIFATVVTQSDNSAFISIPPATANSLGLVQIGSGVHVDANGVISTTGVTSVNGQTGHVTIATGSSGYLGEGTILPVSAVAGNTFYKTGTSTQLPGLQVSTNSGMYPVSEFGLDPLSINIKFFFATTTDGLNFDPTLVNIAFIGDGSTESADVYLLNAANAWINLGTTTANTDPLVDHQFGTFVHDLAGFITQGAYFVTGANWGLSTLTHNYMNGVIIGFDPSYSGTNISYWNGLAASSLGSFTNPQTLDYNRTAPQGYYVYTFTGAWEVAGSASSGGGGTSVPDVDSINYAGSVEVFPWYPVAVPTLNHTVIATTGDDESFQINLPFHFIFNGIDYGYALNGGVWAGTNSYVSFGGSCTEYQVDYADPTVLPQVLGNGICFDSGDSGTQGISTTTSYDGAGNAYEVAVKFLLSSQIDPPTDRIITVIFRSDNTVSFVTEGFVSMGNNPECSGFVANSVFIPFFNIYENDSFTVSIPKWSSLDTVQGFKWVDYAPIGTLIYINANFHKYAKGYYMGSPSGWNMVNRDAVISDADFSVFNGGSDILYYIGNGLDFETIQDFLEYVKTVSVNSVDYSLIGQVETVGIVDISAQPDMFFSTPAGMGSVSLRGAGNAWEVLTDIVSYDQNTQILSVIISGVDSLFVGGALSILYPYMGQDIVALGDMAGSYVGAYEVMSIDTATRTVGIKFNVLYGSTPVPVSGLQLDVTYNYTTIKGQGNTMYITSPFGTGYSGGIKDITFNQVNLTVPVASGQLFLSGGVHLINGSTVEIDSGKFQSWSNLFMGDNTYLNFTNGGLGYINELVIAFSDFPITVKYNSNLTVGFLSQSKSSQLFNDISRNSTVVIEYTPNVGNYAGVAGTYTYDTSAFLWDVSKFYKF